MKSLNKRDPGKYKKVMGIDSSTQGVAWTTMRLYKDKVEPIEWDFMSLKDIKEMDDKLELMSYEFENILQEQIPDHIFIEMPIFVKNPATARKLSFIVAGLVLTAKRQGFSVTLVEISTWKSFIGYTNLNRGFQTEAKRKLGKTEGAKLCDRLRKSQTQRIIKHRWPEFDVEDDNIADSCAIAAYGINELVTELQFEKNKEVALDLKELARLGLEL